MTSISLGIRYIFASLPVKDQCSCPTCSCDNQLSIIPSSNICDDINRQSLKDICITDQSISIWKCPRCTIKNNINSEQCNGCSYNKQKLPSDERILFNSTVPASQTFVSLAVRDRRYQDESRAQNIFQFIINYCQQTETHFIDDQFAPSDRSIGEGNFHNVSQWLRISDIAPLQDDDRTLPWTIFSSPQPSDIQQGTLGNCWLIAALALISEQPRLLEHILLTKTVNAEGVYLVRICHNGLWKTIIVDDCFPCTKHKYLVFTQAKRRQLFVPLIEKACAKVFSSYTSLRSGNLRDGLQLLTGAPCDYIHFKPSNHLFDSDIVWAKLLSACESKLLIGASSGGTGVSREEYTRVHIHGNHAFSILAAHVLANDFSRFVLVRDPHSRSQYTEESVTESVLQQLRLVNSAHRSTGAFWISWSRFLHYFSSITISAYNSDHFDIRKHGQFTRSSIENVTTYCFYVPETSMINISLLYHRHDRTTPTSHTQAFILCDVDKLTSYESIGKRENILVGKYGGGTYWSGLLQAGYYVLIPFSTSFWNRIDKTRDYTIVIHSSVQLDLTIKSKRPTFLTDCLIATVIKTCDKKQEDDAVFYITSSKVGMKLFVAENLSRTSYLTVDIDVLVANNVRHSRHTYLPYNTHDCIPPRYRQLIFITEWTDKKSKLAHLGYSYMHKHEDKMSDSVPVITSAQHDLHSPRAF